MLNVITPLVVPEITQNKVCKCRAAVSIVSNKTYTYQRMKVLEECEVQVSYKKQNEVLPLVVVGGSGPDLYGRISVESPNMAH